MFFFVFDECSFPRISRHGEIESSFENIRKIAGQSILFTNARSPASETVQSLPDILFQTDKPFTVTDQKACFKDGDKWIPAAEIPSIFQAAHQHDYRTSLLGFCHSYRQLLGDSVDYCNIYPLFLSRPSNGFWETFLWRLQWTCKNNKDPISLRCDFLKCIYSRQWFESRMAYRTEMLDILAKSSSDSFAFFHAPWPHQPYVFNPDGSYFGVNWDDARSEDYLREMKFLDNLVGEIVETLHAANNYDDVLLIMTSDHSWRKDFEPEIRKIPHWEQRVPLIIKLPGEKTGHVIDEEFSAIRLKPLFEAIFSGENDPQDLLKILKTRGVAKN